MQFKRTKLEPAAWKWLCWELREVEDLKSRRRQFVEKKMRESSLQQIVCWRKLFHSEKSSENTCCNLFMVFIFASEKSKKQQIKKREIGCCALPRKLLQCKFAFLLFRRGDALTFHCNLRQLKLLEKLIH